MMIEMECPDCGRKVSVSITHCSHCHRFSDVYLVGKPQSNYPGQLICPSCASMTNVANRQPKPSETK